MNKKVIDKLALGSYRNKSLDPKKVNKISALLSKKDLKKYIYTLKLIEKRNSLIISSPVDENSQYSKQLKKLFPNKKIIFQKNFALLLGVQIIDYDMVYDFTLKNSLDKIISNLEKNYD